MHLSRLVPGVGLAVLSLLAACSDDGAAGSSSGTTAAGDGGTSSSSSSSGSVSDAGDCRFGYALLADANNTDSYELQGDKVLFVDRGVGGSGANFGARSGAIKEVDFEGNPPTTLYAAPDGKNVSTYFATATTIYLLQSESSTNPVNVLYTVPRAGGAATPVPTAQTFDSLLSHPFAAQGDDVFVVSAVTSPSTNRIYRINVTTGATTVIAEKEGLVIVGAQLVSGKVWFVAGQGNGGVYQVAADATAPSATLVTNDFCPHLTVGSSAFLCDPGDVKRYALDGSGATLFFQRPANDPDLMIRAGVPGGIVNDDVFLVPALNAEPFNIWQQPLGGSAHTRVACSRGVPFEFRADARSLVWKESGAGGGAPGSRLVRVGR